jgi:predicted dehydrogenase
LIEKPVVVSIDEAQQLKEISERKKMLISPGFTEVYNSVTTGVKNYLKEDAGFEYIDFFRVGQKTIKNDTKDIDVIQDLMTHDLAVLSELIDISKVSTICGSLSSYNKNSNLYELSSVNLMFSSNSFARFLCDRNGTVKIREFSVSKENMYGKFDFMDQTAKIMKKGNIEAFGDNIWYSQNYNTVKVRYSNNPLMDEIKDFILSVGKQSETKVSQRWFQITSTIENIRESLYKNKIYEEK